MRSQELDLEKYDTDKIAANYMELYDPYLTTLVDKKISLLELGIFKGESLRLWRDYFPQGTIVGVDLELPKNFKAGERIRTFKGSQEDLDFLSDMAQTTAPDGFDIIIDDASHLGLSTKKSFWHLFNNHLKSGGIYVIEDWGTGYWDNQPDGKKIDDQTILKKGIYKDDASPSTPLIQSHQYGMVGFIKQLIDEQGASDLSRGNWSDAPTRISKFKNMSIMESIVMVFKR